ncbi:hypothetical protein PVAND_009957 [Polypedilum vanderplanki]|uniref:Uncharacterized protein n=1 Tax=Polypedilum vanderplanki TaxID=319348 RepID=A0A9J6CE45_POLVA|nr:hypothetical protein PVAND_009957 [Polypedilum vanderplanki]
MEFSQFIKSFPIRTDIFDDITYLQKHLRLYIKFHQKLSTRLYVPDSNYDTMRPSKSFNIIRDCMNILENEMEDISKEQKMLTEIVKKSIIQYCETLSKESKVSIDKDVANGFITRALQFHYQKRCFNIMPNNVKTRMTEEELKQKYDEVRSKIINERTSVDNIINKKPSPKSVATSTPQQSLLKPKFRKPSSGSSVTSNKIDKKPVGRKSLIETRHAKVIQKQNAVQQGIKGSRLNLIRALNKVKTEQNDNPECIGDSKKYRSDEDYSDQSSSYDGPVEEQEQEEPVDPLKIPRKRKSPVSSASSDSDLVKCFPPLLPELPAKTDYTKEEFLSIFMLVTPQVADEIRIQKSKRKRRNCAKNEKNDFHYGNFDLNEAAFRLRMCNNRRSILYSPNNKRK